MPPSRNAVAPDGLFDNYTPPVKYTPPRQDRDLAASLKDWFQKAHSWRLPYERTWDLNRFYLKGDQLLARHKVTGDLIRLNAEDSRKLRSQNNILRPTARSLVGKLSKMIPTYKVSPATTDFEEQHGARAGDMILQYIRTSQDLDLVYAQMCGYLPWAGNAFAQLVWDRQAGRKIAYCGVCNYFTPDEDEVGQPCPQCTLQKQEEQIMAKQHAMLQQQHQEDQSKAAQLGVPPPEPPPEPTSAGPLSPDQNPPPLVEAFEGDIAVIVRDPRDVFVQPGCLDIKMATRICIRVSMEVAEARRKYPNFAAFISPDGDVKTQKQRNISDITGSAEDLNDQVYVYEYHEKATESYPKGRLIIAINDIIVEEAESPYYSLGRMPFYHFGFDPVEGELYRDSFITQTWHRQRELNLLETQMREHIEMVLKPKLMNPQGSRITTEEFHANSAQVITYVPINGTPEWISPPELPQGVWNRKQDLLQDVRMSAGITESEQGLSAADPNGRAMAIINAESDQQVGPIMARNNSEWKALHRGCLILYQERAHADKKAAVAGPDGTRMIYFDALNLLQPGWDVKMEQEEGASRNPAIRLTEANDLAGVGYFMDMATGGLDKKAFARYAKLGTPEAGYDQEATERAAASQIPYLVEKGQPWTPRSFDVAGIFAEELSAWLRGPGRRAPQQVSAQVEMIWQYYATWAMTGQMAPPPGQAQGQPGQASQPGSDATAPGGSANNPGRLGTDLAGGGNVQGQAAGQVQQADKTGSNLAKAY